MNQSSNDHARSSATAAHLAVEYQLGAKFNLRKTLHLQQITAVMRRSYIIINDQAIHKIGQQTLLLETSNLRKNLPESQSRALSVTFHP